MIRHLYNLTSHRPNRPSTHLAPYAVVTILLTVFPVLYFTHGCWGGGSPPLSLQLSVLTVRWRAPAETETHLSKLPVRLDEESEVQPSHRASPHSCHRAAKPRCPHRQSLPTPRFPSSCHPPPYFPSLNLTTGGTLRGGATTVFVPSDWRFT